MATSHHATANNDSWTACCDCRTRRVHHNVRKMVERKCVTGDEYGVRDEERGDTERDRERGEEGDGVRKGETKRERER